MQRRRFTDEFKQQIIREAKETHNCALVARNHDLSPGRVAKWVRETDYPVPKGIPLTKETKELMVADLYLVIVTIKTVVKYVTSRLLNGYTV